MAKPEAGQETQPCGGVELSSETGEGGGRSSSEVWLGHRSVQGASLKSDEVAELQVQEQGCGSKGYLAITPVPLLLESVLSNSALGVTERSKLA